MPPTARPVIGPVVPLSTIGSGEGGDLLGAASRPAEREADPLATRVLNRGDAIVAPPGRADDFSWPRADTNASGAADVGPAPDAEDRNQGRREQIRDEKVERRQESAGTVRRAATAPCHDRQAAPSRRSTQPSATAPAFAGRPSCFEFEVRAQHPEVHSMPARDRFLQTQLFDLALLDFAFTE